MINDIWSYIYFSAVPHIFRVFVLLLPIILPVLFFSIFWVLWLAYIRAAFIKKQEYVLLEIKLPKEQYKSPAAMELVLGVFRDSGGEATWIQKYWKGGLRAWFSLEIVSIEGDIHFFIWTRKNYQFLIESKIYSQYPEVEVHEAEDYTNFVKYNHDKIILWGCEFALTKADPYPIKTYIDYGMDKDPKEEYKIDPMTPLLEYLGSLGPGEQVWYQILVQFHMGKPVTKGNIWKKMFGKTTWRKEGEALVDEILKRDPKTKAPLAKTEGEAKFPVLPSLSEGEKNAAAAIERSITKIGFDVGIRAIYMIEGGDFNSVNIAGLIGSWGQYASADLNGFKPTRGLIPFVYPWQDYKNKRKNRVKIRLFDAYRRRSYFHWPYKEQPFVLNTEELATVFHFPGSVAQTPTFKRIDAKKTEPPSNLPQ